MRGKTPIGVALAALALCAACNSAGTSTGNPAPKDDAGDRETPPGGEDNDGAGGLATNGGYCNAGEKTPLALDESSPLGFSPSDILAFAAGSHDETIRWNEPMNLEYGPESGEGTVAITITPKGTAHHVEPAPQGNNLIDSGGTLGIDNTCTSWVEIDVEVTVESSGGALDESFEAVLRAHTPLVTALYVNFKPEELEGSFEASGSGPLAGFVLGGAQIGLRFSSFGVSGAFHGWLKSPPSSDSNEQVAVGPGEPIATIGAAACNDGGFAVGASDTVEGVTMQDALDLLGEHSEIDITWEDNTTTTSTFAFAPASGGCVLLDNEVPGDLTIVIGGKLSMTSADERLDGEYGGRFEAHIANEAITRIVFHIDGKMMSNVELGGAYYGFPDIDVSAFDAAGTALNITVTPASIEGTITLIAYTYQCDERPAPPDEPGGDADPGAVPGDVPNEGGGGSSSPGCAGAAPTELVTGVLR